MYVCLNACMHVCMQACMYVCDCQTLLLFLFISDPFDETTLRRMREQHNCRKDNSKTVAANDGKC